MYAPKADADEAAAFGFTIEDLEDYPLEVWPDNLAAVNVFDAMSTQWRMGFNGPIGLDYGVLREIWQRLKIKSEDRDNVFADLRVMENAALEQMRRE